MNDNSGQRVPLLFAKEGGEATFLGLPRCENLDALDADVAIIGVPCATPYPHLGAYSRNAPAAIRSAVAGYAAALGHVDFDFGEPLLGDGRVRVVDCGDLDCDEADAEGYRQKIEQAVPGREDVQRVRHPSAVLAGIGTPLRVVLLSTEVHALER